MGACGGVGAVLQRQKLSGQYGGELLQLVSHHSLLTILWFWEWQCNRDAKERQTKASARIRHEFTRNMLSYVASCTQGA